MEFVNARTTPMGGKHILLRARVGTLLFIASEIMLFGGLLSSFVVYRSSQLVWPPEGLPFYPVSATLVNTFFLLVSGITNAIFRSTARLLWAIVTIVFGLLFVVLQGIEWANLIAHGLTMTVDAYGSYFYLVIGTHALHAVAGTLWYLYALLQYRKYRLWNGAVEAANLFWFFVVAIWPIIFWIVYL